MKQRILCSFTVCLIPFLFVSCTPKQQSHQVEKVGRNPTKVAVDAVTQQQLGIEVQPALAQSVEATITATGLLQINEDKTWPVGAVTEGRIVAVPVHLGDTVKAGQILAQMHSHEVHDSRADRRQAISEWERSKIMADQAERVRDRTKRLFELKAASREQVETAETQFRSALQGVLTAQAGVEKANAHLTEFLDVPLQDSSSATASNADRVPIRSPATGTVMERRANVGSVVSSGDTVVTVSDLSSLWLIAAVNEADLSKVQKGQAVRTTVRAYPDRKFPGKVFQLGERLDPQTRTLQVRVLVSNTQGLLKPDMFATAEFKPATGEVAVHVPESAVQKLNGKAIVFVQDVDGSFHPREVRIGGRTDRQIAILAGLEPNTKVVTNGALLLKSQLLKSVND